MVCLTASERIALDLNTNAIKDLARAYRMNSVEEAISLYLGMYLVGGTEYNNRTLNTSETAHKICSMAGDFVNEMEKATGAESFRESIRRNAHAMEPDKGYLYISSIKWLHNLIASAPQEQLWNPDRFALDQADIRTFIKKAKDVCLDPGEFSLTQRIDQIADSLSLDGLLSGLLRAADDELIDAAWENENLLADTVQQTSAQLYSKTEEAALKAAAFFAMVRKGEIDGIPSSTTVEGTCLFCLAQGEIWDVYAQLNRGEIEQIQVGSLLRKVLHAVTNLVATTFLSLLEVGPPVAVFYILDTIGAAFAPAFLLSVGYFLILIGLMADFNWEVIGLAEDIAEQWELSIRANKAKKLRLQKESPAQQNLLELPRELLV